jgi:ribosome-associated protein
MAMARATQSEPAPRPAAKPKKSTAARLERQGVLEVLRACEAKKAADIALLELEKGTSAFTDYFIICSGSNPRQIQAISDEVEQRLATAGMRPTHIEGYQQAEWVLLDYVDFVVHVFSEAARKFYDLERLWKSATRLNPAQLDKPASTAAPVRKASAAGRASSASAETARRARTGGRTGTRSASTRSASKRRMRKK